MTMEKTRKVLPRDGVLKDRLKTRAIIKPLNKKHYRAFFNNELKLFLEYKIQSKESLLRTTFISPEGSIFGDSKKASFVGTKWTVLEKEVFFEFLARYGIGQIELIQEKIGTKSILEIWKYYELLKTTTEKYKRRKSKFLQLVRYDEIPQAIEMDEPWIRIEEDLAASFMGNEHDDDVENPVDDEDELINGEALATICDFFQMDHLTSQPVKFSNSDYVNFKELAKDVIKSIIMTIIKNKVFNSDRNLKKIESFQDKLVIESIQENEVLEAFRQILPNRSSTMYNYLRKIHDRLDFKISNEKNQIVAFVPYEEKLKLQSLVEIRLKEKELQRYVPDESVDDETLEDYPLESDVLDNKLALKIFYRSTFDIERRDSKESKKYLSNLIVDYGHLRRYSEARTDVQILENLSRTRTTENIEWNLEDIYKEIEEDETLIEPEYGMEVTDEMMELYNITFD